MDWVREIFQKKAERKQVRTFGIVLSLLLLVVGLVQFFKASATLHYYFGAASIIIFLLSIFIQTLILPIYRIALILAHILGWINTRLFLGLIYFLIFTPISLLFKVIGKDPLNRKINKTAQTYWQKRDISAIDKESYYKQF